ncbi:MAG TPA: hypothetical protein VKR83_20030 [Ktedonobacteraceae bacterium]|nr:hypothetical protein [Ktedonobacteraceae bacterium]
MRIKHHTLLLFSGLAALLLLCSACSTSVGTGSGSPQSSLSVLQVLQNSQKAMSKLKSTHINLQVTGSGQALSSTAPTTGAVNFSLTGSGDEALPDQEEMRFTASQSVTNTTNALTEILSGNKIYTQIGGQWYMLDSSTSGVGNPFAGLGSPDMTELLGLLVYTHIIDHGDQSLNGLTLRHITLQLDKPALKQLLDSDQQLVNMLGQQNIDALIDNAKSINATLDLWIDETQFYVHRSELKLNLNVNAASLSQSVTPTVSPTIKTLIPSNVITNLDSIVDLSKFNEIVSITPPANAIPVAIPTITPTATPG